jgi:uncharacterized protein
MSQAPLPSALNPHQQGFLAYQQQFVNYLRDPRPELLANGLPPNASVYANLLHRKMDGSLCACFPITRSLLKTERWDNLVKVFIRDHHCQSPLYREIPDEFVDFLINAKPQLGLPDFMVDLAHFEWMELVLETANPTPDSYRSEESGDVLEDIPVLNPVLHLLRYRYPVHTITADDKDWQPGEMRSQGETGQPVILAGLRDNVYRIHFIEVNTVTARLIELLQEGFRTGRNALIQLAIELHYPSPESMMLFGEDILDQLVAQQIIFGVKHEI